jgi:3-deoxy-D-manno-octulosonic-acid transferase
MLLPYRLAVGTLRVASPLLSMGESKLARGMAGRRHAHELLRTWGRTLRDPARPVLWFHAPSVGEGLQAQAVIGAILERMPEAQIVYTFFSPSAEGLARRLDAEVAAYLPWDLLGPSRAALEAVRPDLLVFTKTEVWPVLTAEAVRAGVPVVMIGAAVPEGAGRMRWPARPLLRSTWARLTVACANTDADAGRLAILGVREEVIRVTGDPGIDSAARRFEGADPASPYLAPFRAGPRPTLVAGSTWPADEAVLLPGLAAVRGRVPSFRVVIAPHEPDEGHVESLLASLRADGWSAATLADIEATGTVDGIDAVVVDRVGVLAHLYGVGDVSYVGGGFHDAGLHSVLEPAAAGTPMVFGPRHRNARAAGELVAAGGAKIAGDSEEFALLVGGWLSDAEEGKRIGRVAREYIVAHLGAADRSAEILLETIERAGARGEAT